MKKRVISAIVALAIIIPLLVLKGIPFALGCGVLSVLAYKEVLDLKESHHKIPNIMKALGFLSLMIIIFFNYKSNNIVFGISYVGNASAIILLIGPVIFFKNEEEYSSKDAFYLLGFVTLIGLFFNSLITIVNFDIKYLIYLILITTMTDTFAMLFGMLVGKHKLIPNVSPNKTWEGTICGSIVGTFIGCMYFSNVIDSSYSLMLIILMTLGLTIVGQIGDLVFSKIKRENKIKDFSQIMPGHGGILDRLDSLIFVVLTFMVFFSIIG